MSLRKPSKLRLRLRAIHHREQVVSLAVGALVLFGVVGGLFLVAFGIDWVLRLPAPVRAAAAVAIACVALARAWRCGWVRFRPRFDAPRTALAVERRHGGFDSLLVSGVQLAREAGRGGGTSAALAARTVERADAAARRIDADRVVPLQPIGVPGLWACGLVAALAVIAILDLATLRTAGLRIFAPWVAAAYPTRTQIELEQGDRTVKEGQPLRLGARIAGRVPASAEIVLRTGDGEPRARALEVSGGTCEYKADTVFRSFDYRIEAGDAVSDWHSVEVVRAPRITRATVTLDFPDYTRRPAGTVEALTLTVPEGTEVAWRLELDRAVRAGEFRPAGAAAEPLEISDGGRTASFRTVAADSRGYSFGWTGAAHGFGFASPRHFLQVAPDQAPSVELTAPAANLFATLGREIDFAFRARDDHGLGAAAIAYRVNKTAAQSAQLEPPAASDGGEHRVGWDYREALPDLAIGDTVTFAVEVADRYPAGDGPQRARSDSRRVQFLSRDDYLAQVRKQKRRLLTEVRSIYREERSVHDVLRQLDPADDSFAQACQLEAVRQDLMRERLGGVRTRIDALVADLEANNAAEADESAALGKLGDDLAAIGSEHIGRAATMLRDVAALAAGGGARPDPDQAVRMVHSAARELALVVLDLGFAEASDVMARELHAAAQAQAELRLGDAAPAAVAAHQRRLADETARLLAAVPRNTESSSKDALVAFNLSRLVNQLQRGGLDAKMRAAAELVAGGGEDGETRARVMQGDVIAALLRAEFRLRLGAEFEALAAARAQFDSQAAALRQLRAELERIRAGDADAEPALAPLGGSLATMHRNLRLLLMPEIPARSVRLLDELPPAAPDVNGLMAAAQRGLEGARGALAAGDVEGASRAREAAQGAFEELADLTGRRMRELTRQRRMQALVTSTSKLANQVLMLEERLLVVIEQAEDAAADGDSTASLGALNAALAEDARGLCRAVAQWSDSHPDDARADAPISAALVRAAEAIGAATPMLEANQPDAAIDLQDDALVALEEASHQVAQLAATRAAFAGVLATADAALAPAPLLAEIESEQEALSAAADGAQPGALAQLVVPQKNLIHAVDAVLASLDPLAHKIESGTVMLFAKEDMDAAAEGLEVGEHEEALDAQAFVVESLQDLRATNEALEPEYRYVLALTEALFDLVPRTAALHSAVRELPAEAREGAAEELASEARELAGEVLRLTGMERVAEAADELADTLAQAADPAALEDSAAGFAEVAADLQQLMENLAYLMAPPASLSYLPEKSPAVVRIEKAIAVAGPQWELTRATRAAAAADTEALANSQRTLATLCASLTPQPQPQPQRPAPAEPGDDGEPQDAPAPGGGAAPDATAATDKPEPEPALEPGAQPAAGGVSPAFDLLLGVDVAGAAGGADRRDSPPADPAPDAPHPKLVAARDHLAAAAEQLEAGAREAAIEAQAAADEALRHFIVDQTLAHVAVPPPGPPQPPAPSDDALPDDGELQLFLPGALTGEKPAGGRLEWEVLGRRERAALNENFARELPLEYRSILKDYYQRLTQ